MDSPIILQIVSACEKAAIAAYEWYGLGDNMAADKAAVDAMRDAFNKIDMQGTIVIGEGERDKAPMLYIGEQVGTGRGVEVDIAVDPLEGTSILAYGKPGALAVCAVTDRGGFLNAPDTYMEKIAIGFDVPEQIISLEVSALENLRNVARAKKCQISELVVTVLDRPRHQDLIDQIRHAGARINLIGDGDIAGVIGCYRGKSDLYMGIGGAPEGVLAAAALKATEGQFSGRLVFNNEDEKNRAQNMGITDLNKIYNIDDLASGNIIFVACGVTDGNLVSGVDIVDGIIQTESLVMTANDRLQRYVVSEKRVV